MRIILARWFLLSIPKLNFYAEGWSENILWFDSEQYQHNTMSIVASVGGRFSPCVYLLFNIHYLRIPMIDKLIDLCQEHRFEQSFLSFQVCWPLKEWWCHLLLTTFQNDASTFFENLPALMLSLVFRSRISVSSWRPLKISPQRTGDSQVWFSLCICLQLQD